MTLILSELSRYGIVMIADSAVTQIIPLPSGNVPRVLNGVMKLQIIPQLSAGISMWGLGTIPASRIPTDIWIYDFIKQRTDLTSLQAFADALAYELQR